MTNNLQCNGSHTVCPHCGQTLPPVGVPKGLHLSRFAMVIFQSVQKSGENGISSDRLFDRLYSGDPDGGPLSGKKSMWVQVKNLNRKLAPYGLVIRAPNGGRGTTTSYTLRTCVPTTQTR